MLDNPLGQGGVREGDFGALLIVAIGGPLGAVLVSFIIAKAWQEITLMHALEMRHQENKSFMRHALENLNIPQELQDRVYALHHYQKVAHDMEAFKALFFSDSLSPPLESALRIYLYRENVLQSVYFKDKNQNYILEVIRALQDQIYLPGDYVTRRGELGESMFFIATGNVTVLVPDASSIRDSDVESAVEVCTKQKGDFFGEIALVQDVLRTAWIRSDTYSLLSVLYRARVEAIWHYFPEERQALVDKVLETAQKDLERVQAQMSCRASGRSPKSRQSQNLTRSFSPFWWRSLT
eukprot:5126482-Amphidinium_carterae.1